jgi:exopolyphosphatase/guanosine-5'-triphosphate,3'-diphosphate pyrophosphatase
MLIAEPRGHQFEIVDAFSKSVHLGQGLDYSGALSQAAIKRAIAALKICGNKLRQHDIKSGRFIATAACRQAKNGHSFLSKVTKETGLSLEMISPEEEARLAVIGCASLVADDVDHLMVVDIGGGSTELVWIDLSQMPSIDRATALMTLDLSNQDAISGLKVMDWVSVPLGVSTLEQQYQDVQEDGARFALMSCEFEGHLEQFARGFRTASKGKKFQVIGTSGTMTTLAATHLGLNKYSRDAVDGLKMTSEQVNMIVEHYLRLGPEGRGVEPCIGRSRSALIMSGCAIVQAIMRSWPTQDLTVADRGLREGLLFSQIASHAGTK